jgi:hypothetical protein
MILFEKWSQDKGHFRLNWQSQLYLLSVEILLLWQTGLLRLSREAGFGTGSCCVSLTVRPLDPRQRVFALMEVITFRRHFSDSLDIVLVIML